MNDEQPPAAIDLDALLDRVSTAARVVQATEFDGEELYRMVLDSDVEALLKLAREAAALREALRHIADDPGDDRGVLDEWSEALAFKRCQEIAEEALTARRAAP
jgi:hypothetical protein